jgi:hypothetical protein
MAANLICWPANSAFMWAKSCLKGCHQGEANDLWFVDRQGEEADLLQEHAPPAFDQAAQLRDGATLSSALPPGALSPWFQLTSALTPEAWAPGPSLGLPAWLRNHLSWYFLREDDLFWTTVKMYHKILLTFNNLVDSFNTLFTRVSCSFLFGFFSILRYKLI